ncbi:MAG: class B sortase [Cellulosilyticaceae bacterium]
MAKKIINIITIFLIVVSIIVSIKIISIKRVPREQEQKQKQEEPTKVYEEESEPPTSLLESLKTQNPDAIGWIDIPETAIQYPLMQTIDNDYYLQHTFDKEENSAGSIYMDYRNDPLFTDQNTVIYGHDMKNGSMFHNLRYMRKQEYVQKHPSIFVTVADEILEYEIFSVYPTEAAYDYRTPNYKEITQYEEFLSRIKKRSIIDTAIVPDKEDKILTLSTCAYDFEDGRLAVHARLKR